MQLNKYTIIYCIQIVFGKKLSYTSLFIAIVFKYLRIFEVKSYNMLI